VSKNLPRRLLRLSSGGLPLILCGRTLREHFGPELDRALGRRVLIELPRLEEWPPCPGCDQECDARPIRELEGRLVAMCPHDAASDEVLSREDVRQFLLDAEELCLAIREDSGLGRDGPTMIAPGIWLIGQTGDDHAPPRIVFVGFDFGLGAAAVIALLKRVAGPRSALLVLTGEGDLELRLALGDAGIDAVCFADVLVEDARAPFHLDLDLLTGVTPRPRLLIRRSDRSASFDATSAILPPQPFQLLLFMLTEAQVGRPLIDNRAIERELWGTVIHARQVSDPIRRLREALAPVVGGLDRAQELIQNRPGSYLVNKDFALFEIT
jgi:hypothetical protein